MSPPPDVERLAEGDRDVSPRFAERRRELESATTNKVTTAAEAGRVLALAGDLLRRSEALGDARMDVEIALEKIESQAAEAFVESIDEKAEHDKLARGLEDAFEAILEEGEERVLYMNSAENALTARDAIASARAAMNVASTEVQKHAAKLDQKIAKIDGALAKKARLLVALNALRRREAGSLDAGERAAAWWYSSRANCDFLISLYHLQETDVNVTQKHNAAHLATCADCQRDVESASLAYTPQHIPASSLWRREHDRATPSEIAFMDAHAATCNDCKSALDLVLTNVDE